MKSPKMSREASNRFSRRCSGCLYPRKVSSHFRSDIIGQSAEQLAQAYDADHGGLGKAPKFPNVGVYELFCAIITTPRGTAFWRW